MASTSLCPHLIQEYFRRVGEISTVYKSQIVTFVDYQKVSIPLLERKIIRKEEHEAIKQLPSDGAKMEKVLSILQKRMWGLENLITALIETDVESWLVEEMFQKYVHYVVNEIKRIQAARVCQCFEHERWSFIRKAAVKFFQICDNWLYTVGTHLGFLDQSIFPSRNVLQRINNLLPLSRSTGNAITFPEIDSSPLCVAYGSNNAVTITEVHTDSEQPQTKVSATVSASQQRSDSAGRNDVTTVRRSPVRTNRTSTTTSASAKSVVGQRPKDATKLPITTSKTTVEHASSSVRLPLRPVSTVHATSPQQYSNSNEKSVRVLPKTQMAVSSIDENMNTMVVYLPIHLPMLKPKPGLSEPTDEQPSPISCILDPVVLRGVTLDEESVLTASGNSVLEAPRVDFTANQSIEGIAETPFTDTALKSSLASPAGVQAIVGGTNRDPVPRQVLTIDSTELNPKIVMINGSPISVNASTTILGKESSSRIPGKKDDGVLIENPPVTLGKANNSIPKVAMTTSISKISRSTPTQSRIRRSVSVGTIPTSPVRDVTSRLSVSKITSAQSSKHLPSATKKNISTSTRSTVSTTPRKVAPKEIENPVRLVDRMSASTQTESAEQCEIAEKKPEPSEIKPTTTPAKVDKPIVGGNVTQHIISAEPTRPTTTSGDAETSTTLSVGRVTVGSMSSETTARNTVTTPTLTTKSNSWDTVATSIDTPSDTSDVEVFSDSQQSPKSNFQVDFERTSRSLEAVKEVLTFPLEKSTGSYHELKAQSMLIENAPCKKEDVPRTEPTILDLSMHEAETAVTTETGLVDRTLVQELPPSNASRAPETFTSSSSESLDDVFINSLSQNSYSKTQDCHASGSISSLMQTSLASIPEESEEKMENSHVKDDSVDESHDNLSNAKNYELPSWEKSLSKTETRPSATTKVTAQSIVKTASSAIKATAQSIVKRASSATKVSDAPKSAKTMTSTGSPGRAKPASVMKTEPARPRPFTAKTSKTVAPTSRASTKPVPSPSKPRVEEKTKSLSEKPGSKTVVKKSSFPGVYQDSMEKIQSSNSDVFSSESSFSFNFSGSKRLILPSLVSSLSHVTDKSQSLPNLFFSNISLCAKPPHSRLSTSESNLLTEKDNGHPLAASSEASSSTSQHSTDALPNGNTSSSSSAPKKLADAASQTVFRLKSASPSSPSKSPLPSSSTTARATSLRKTPSPPVTPSPTARKKINTARVSGQSKTMTAASNEKSGSTVNGVGSARVQKIAAVSPTRPVWSNKKPAPLPLITSERSSPFTIEEYSFLQWTNEWSSRQEKKRAEAANRATAQTGK